jgi:hypothetical protein
MMDASDEAGRREPARVEDHPGEAGPGARITLLYVRPENAERTELDRRIGAIAERYARWVDLRVVGAGEEAFRSPALLLLRAGEVVGEAMGALLPMRELDDVVRRAVEWPIPA